MLYTHWYPSLTFISGNELGYLYITSNDCFFMSIVCVIMKPNWPVIVSHWPEWATIHACRNWQCLHIQEYTSIRSQINTRMVSNKQSNNKKKPLYPIFPPKSLIRSNSRYNLLMSDTYQFKEAKANCCHQRTRIIIIVMICDYSVMT